MLNRGWALAALGSAIAFACGGTAFEGTRSEDVGGAAGHDSGTGGEPDTGSSAGGAPPSDAGSPAVSAGTPSDGGEASGGGGSGGAPPTPPSIAIVQKTRTGILGNADPTLTLTQPPAAGNALIVGVTCFSDLDNCVIPEGGVTDNQGNQYRLVVEGASIVSSDTHGTRPYLFIAESVAVSTAPFIITVNPNGTPPTNYQNFAWGVLEVSGLATENSVDQIGYFPNTCCFTSTTVTTEGATAQANELAVAVHSARSNDNAFHYGHEPSWIEQHVNNDGVSQASQHSLVTRILTEPAQISHTWTHNEPTRGVAAVIATFRGAAP
jgi:hypothetical protein